MTQLFLYVLWFKFFVVYKCANQVNFYLPLSQIVIMNAAQRKIRIKLVLHVNFLNAKKLNYNINMQLFMGGFIRGGVC